MLSNPHNFQFKILFYIYFANTITALIKKTSVKHHGTFTYGTTTNHAEVFKVRGEVSCMTKCMLKTSDKVEFMIQNAQDQFLCSCTLGDIIGEWTIYKGK